MNFLHIMIPILIGAVIGYCTNYIAIKMLFHPRREYRIGGAKVPFTPGVIPKNQPRIAAAVGNAISEQLLTSDDLVNSIKESGARAAFAEQIADAVCNTQESIHALTENSASFSAEALVENSSSYISSQVLDGIAQTDLQPVIQKIAENSLSSLLQNPMIGMFLNDKVLGSLYEKIESAIKEYAATDGEAFMKDFVQEKLEALANEPIAELAENLSLERRMVYGAAEEIFDNVVVAYGASMIQKINISRIVEEKINEMKVEDLENLVMSVMKNELQTVINLGALIGALIGIINIFV